MTEKWVKITGVVPPGAYPTVEAARLRVFQQKSGLPDSEVTSWGIVFWLLAADYLASNPESWQAVKPLVCEPETITPQELYQLMSKSRSLTPDVYAHDPERAFKRLLTICEQIGINPLDIDEKLIRPYTEWVKEKMPDQAILKEMREENERLKARLAALEGGGTATD